MGQCKLLSLSPTISGQFRLLPKLQQVSHAVLGTLWRRIRVKYVIWSVERPDVEWNQLSSDMPVAVCTLFFHWPWPSACRSFFLFSFFRYMQFVVTDASNRTLDVMAFYSLFVVACDDRTLFRRLFRWLRKKLGTLGSFMSVFVLLC